jgi:A/G-specific adenine glycosylase
VLLETENEQEKNAFQFLDELLQHQSYVLISTSEIFTQQLTHQRINGRFVHVRLKKKLKLNGDYSLVKKININEYAFPRFINSYLEKSF